MTTDVVANMNSTDWVFDVARPMLCLQMPVEPPQLGPGYAFEEKVDGIRALIAVGPNGFRIVNRNQKDITHRYPDLATGLRLPFGAVLDGEIIPMNPDRDFEDIARRDRQQNPGSILSLAQEIPALYVVFDILMHDDLDVRGMTYAARRALLETFMFTEANYRLSFVSSDASLYEQLKMLQREGVVAKRLASLYMSGRQSAWLKYKFKYTVSLIAVGYEKGTGKRAQCGKFLLAALEDGTPVPMGKVGSGFTDAQMDEFKAALDQRRMLIFEVETMGLTKAGALRQPIFKGTRDDLELKDCTTEQLEDLPRGKSS